MHPSPSDLPARPVRPEADPNRRDLLKWLTGLLGTLAGVAAGIPIVGYLLGAVLRAKPDEWTDIGAVTDFAENETRLVANFDNKLAQPWDGMTAHAAAYVRRLQGEEFKVFAIYCTHLGCPVSWFPQSGLFMCPCHGGVYYEDGGHASGPPPRGLYEYPYRIAQGRLEIMSGHLPTLQDTFKHPKTI